MVVSLPTGAAALGIIAPVSVASSFLGGLGRLGASRGLLTGDEYFTRIQCERPPIAMVVNSTPTVGGSTRARILFQLLLASAQQEDLAPRMETPVGNGTRNGVDGPGV